MLVVITRSTEHALAPAERHGARFVLVSTRETCGSPAREPAPAEGVTPIGRD